MAFASGDATVQRFLGRVGMFSKRSILTVLICVAPAHSAVAQNASPRQSLAETEKKIAEDQLLEICRSASPHKESLT